MEVVLKCPKDLNENLSKFLKEWKYHESCLDSTEIINFHSTSGKVNEIQESGSLRDCIIINEDNEKDLI
ncbi:kinase-like domain-containing protein [Rhizophagus irregularis DAOM 181602=DAOM 197198]|nr:kinase-like domain-containing protein [Rhizophagus irregularis DAOM 181602=DAOM 197198]